MTEWTQPTLPGIEENETLRAELDAAKRAALISDSVTAQTKALMERRTGTLKARAERAEGVIEKVRARHRQCLECEHDGCPICWGVQDVCMECRKPYPCPTAQDLGEL